MSGRDKNFNWKEAEADIEERGGDLGRLYTRNEKNRDSYLKEMELNPNRYKSGSNRGTSSGGSEGCYVATCVYGSYDAEPVRLLRRYRDERMAKHPAGRMFIRVYYWLSPKFVRCFGGNSMVKYIWKRMLDPIVDRVRQSL